MRCEVVALLEECCPQGFVTETANTPTLACVVEATVQVQQQQRGCWEAAGGSGAGTAAMPQQCQQQPQGVVVLVDVLVGGA